MRRRFYYRIGNRHIVLRANVHTDLLRPAERMNKRAFALENAVSIHLAYVCLAHRDVDPVAHAALGRHGKERFVRVAAVQYEHVAFTQAPRLRLFHGDERIRKHDHAVKHVGKVRRPFVEDALRFAQERVSARLSPDRGIAALPRADRDPLRQGPVGNVKQIAVQRDLADAFAESTL